MGQVGATPARFASSAFRSSVETMYTIEWSADCRVVGFRFAGSPMMPNAGSYAVIVIFLNAPPCASSSSAGAFSKRSIIACSAPADWCSYSPSLKCIPITAKSSPEVESRRSNGDASFFSVLASPAFTALNICPGPSKMRKTASGLRKMSRGPRNPAIDRFTARIAASVLIAAEAPFESLSCLPARIARKGTKCATTMPIALSICSAVAPTIAPNTAADAIAPCSTWSIL